MPYYDLNPVAAHGSTTATIFLLNEAPGQCEAEAGIPLIGQQGGNVYRSFRSAGIPWAVELPQIKWPSKSACRYRNRDAALEKRFQQREELLETRRHYMVCSNAFDRWPKSRADTCDSVRPADADVLSVENMNRLRSEISVSHKILLICGEAAWIACVGKPIQHPSQFEGTKLNADNLVIVNQRLESSFRHAWYMGHTRRWSLNARKTSAALKSVANFAGWF
jgi:hypothetical protein